MVANVVELVVPLAHEKFDRIGHLNLLCAFVLVSYRQIFYLSSFVLAMESWESIFRREASMSEIIIAGVVSWKHS